MEEKLLDKCMEWLGYPVDVDMSNISTIISEDEPDWNRRIYLIAWNDDDGFTQVYIIRVWTADNGNTINLSEDYKSCVEMEDFVYMIPSMIEAIKRIKA